jgi:hypothetical protein
VDGSETSREVTFRSPFETQTPILLNVCDSGQLPLKKGTRVLL